MAQIEIGFIGYDNADMVVYIARLFAASGKKVAVVDYTKKLVMLKITALPDALAKSTGYYKDILMLNGAVEHQKDKESQDVILHYFGYHLEREELKQCPTVVYATDMAVYNAQLLKEVELAPETTAYLVLRNYVPFKYDEKYLCEIIGRKFDSDHMFTIPYDESDYKSRCYLCVDKRHRIASLSSSMKTAVLSLFTNTVDKKFKRKEQATLLRRA